MSNCETMEAAARAGNERVQKLKEEIEDEEIVQFSRTGIDKRVLLVALLTSNFGEMASTDEDIDAQDLEPELPVDEDIGAPPATKEMIWRLKGMNPTQEQIDVDTNCGICMEEFTLESIIHILPGCQHIFHKLCIRRWLRQRWTCAVCRQPLRFVRVGKVRGAKTDTHYTNASVEENANLALNSTEPPSVKSSHDEPILVRVLAYVERQIADRPPLNTAPPAVVVGYYTPPETQNHMAIYRQSRSAYLEIVMIILALPSHCHRLCVHLNVPASAEAVAVKVSMPAFLEDHQITVQATKENISSTVDIASVVFGKSEEYTFLDVNIPACPEASSVKAIAGQQVSLAEDVDFEVNTKDRYILPTSFQLERVWCPTHIV